MKSAKFLWKGTVPKLFTGRPEQSHERRKPANRNGNGFRVFIVIKRYEMLVKLFEIGWKENFDYTSAISGYLKSIEQLLHIIVMVNVDNNCKISMSRVTSIHGKAYDNAVRIFENRGGAWNELFVNTKK